MSSTDKKKLLKSGDELKAQVEKNTEDLIESIWRIRGKIPKSPHEIRALMEHWHDLVNRDLQDSAVYDEKYAELEKAAQILRQQDRRNWRINRRYRVWTPPYICQGITPLRLEFEMDQFYEVLHGMIIGSTDGKLEQADLLVFVDFMIDGTIHPWADGCGRNATAAVMWLSILLPHFCLPVFGPRDEHYRSIRDPKAHFRYFRKCLQAT